jgi:CDP-paratose 2-epimerase
LIVYYQEPTNVKVLITGSSGLIGSEAVRYFDRRGASVYGIDNNMRADFFGPEGDTAWTLRHLRETCRRFEHRTLDIRDRRAMAPVFEELRPDLIIHCAAQPSHDLAKSRPFDDFDVNAGGTLNLLEATRQHAPDAVFILMSTNKVYGDVPNELPLVELPTRYDYADAAHGAGIDETCRIDRCTHSLFGVSKLAGDVMTQEYGRYFGMKTGVFRGGCLTGPFHSAVKLHGFLAYMVRVALKDEPYTIIGYKGKQVRDQIHSEDVIRAFEAFYENPRPGEVYNLGGGRDNSASLLELLDRIGQLNGRRIRTVYEPEPRVGDHIVYISNLSKIRAHYPDWDLTQNLEDIVEDVFSMAKSALQPAGKLQVVAGGHRVELLSNPKR